MYLYLIRHGTAEDVASTTPADKDVSNHSEIERDELRSLTKVGRKKIAQVADRLARLDVAFDLIVTSPLVRAHQTAQILIDKQLSSHLEVSEDLKPQGNLPAWLMWWQDSPHARPISKLALVGHEPNLSHWAELLLFGKVVNRLVLKKGGIIGLKFADDRLTIGAGQLVCSIPPKYLLDGKC
jgi:phosphohistidine phosphatase